MLCKSPLPPRAHSHCPLPTPHQVCLHLLVVGPAVAARVNRCVLQAVQNISRTACSQASCSILLRSDTGCRSSFGRRPLLSGRQGTATYAGQPLILCKASRQDEPQTLRTSRLKGLGTWLQKPAAPKPVPVDTKPPLQLPFQPQDPEGPGGGFKLSQLSYIWGLGMLSICYLHHSTTGCELLQAVLQQGLAFVP